MAGRPLIAQPGISGESVYILNQGGAWVPTVPAQPEAAAKPPPAWTRYVGGVLDIDANGAVTFRRPGLYFVQATVMSGGYDAVSAAGYALYLRLYGDALPQATPPFLASCIDTAGVFPELIAFGSVTGMFSVSDPAAATAAFAAETLLTAVAMDGSDPAGLVASVVLQVTRLGQASDLGG